MNCGQQHHISRPYVEYKLPRPPAALISPPCPSCNTPGCGAYASPANANFTLSVSLFLVHECLSPLPRLHHPPPSSPATSHLDYSIFLPARERRRGGGRQERGRREAIPALINIRHNRRERVSRDVRRWLFTPRETDYVQLKECMCASQREKGKKKVPERMNRATFKSFLCCGLDPPLLPPPSSLLPPVIC